MIHVGFTGTREGMSLAQLGRVRDVLDEDLSLNGFIANHGDCVGADEQFHAICREERGGPVGIVIHPSTHRLRAFCCGDETCDPMAPLKRNAAIVSASQVMIAAPLEDEPQPRGGTWATVRLAIRALRAGRLSQLFVVGRDGQLLDHEAWKL